MRDTITINRRPTEAQIIAWANSALRNVPDKSLTRQFMRDLLRDFADGLGALSVEDATPAPREDGYSVGVRAALESAARLAEQGAMSVDGGQARVEILSLAGALLADAPALPDARAGAVEPVGLEWINAKPYFAVAVTPDGQRIPVASLCEKMRVQRAFDCGTRTPACTATDGTPAIKHPRSGTELPTEVFADPGRRGWYFRERQPDSVARYVRDDLDTPGPQRHPLLRTAADQERG